MWYRACKASKNMAVWLIKFFQYKRQFHFRTFKAIFPSPIMHIWKEHITPKCSGNNSLKVCSVVRKLLILMTTENPEIVASRPSDFKWLYWDTVISKFSSGKNNFLYSWYKTNFPRYFFVTFDVFVVLIGI